MHEDHLPADPVACADPLTVTVTLTAFPDIWAYVRTGLAVVDPVADFRAWVAERVATALDETPLDHRANVAVSVDGDQPWAIVLTHRDNVAAFHLLRQETTP